MPVPERSSRITTWSGVSAILRPSGSLAASTALPHLIVWPRVETLAADATLLSADHEDRLDAPPRSKVETIMKANKPASPEHTARGVACPGAAEATVHGTSVMSNVTSSSLGSGLWLLWARIRYCQVDG